MNIENELKLIPKNGITREQVIKVLASQGITVSEKGKIVHQEDTYFDDKEGTLEKTGGSFRIRRKKGEIKVTYKIPKESNTEYKQRREYEIKVPEEYGQNIDMELAIKLLKEQYPELVFPENMGEIVTVINDRNKVDLTCQDGTVLEMAFDTLKGKDKNGDIYSIKPEIEFETKFGNSENLTTVYRALVKAFPTQIAKNTLSKYARTKKEIDESKLTLDEVAVCAMLSQILASSQFDKLRYKGQILHKYDKPTIPELDSFKDFDYLVDKISKIKSGEYKAQIPRNIAEKEEIAKLLESGRYEVKDEIDLEDMFCLLLSDVHYTIADEVLADFLYKNYYQDDKAITNRLSHSQQVMLGTGLICKSSQVRADMTQRLTAMISALSHDIGHVPFSHIMEQDLQEKIGSFSHDSNGADVIEGICETNYDVIYDNIKRYMGKIADGISEKDIEKTIGEKKEIIQMAIREHSRTNSEQRGEGIIVQGPREADKILYVVSDIRDLQQYLKDEGMEPAEFFSTEFVKAALQKICKYKPYEYDEVKANIDEVFLKPLKDGKYGRTVVNVINTIEFSRFDKMDYYNVDQDIWDFMEETIARTKDIKRELGIDDTRPKIADFSDYITRRKLVGEYLEPNEGDRSKARINGLHDITNMGELDAFEYANDDILGFSKDDIDRLKKGDYSQLSPEKIHAVRKRTYELLEKALVQTGHGNEKELAELVEEVKQYGIDELIQTYLSAPVTTKVEDKRLREFKVEDVQLKIKPSRKVTITSILTALGVKKAEYQNCSFDDFYFKTNLQNATLSLRRFHGFNGEDKKQIRVKKKVAKKVSEIIRDTYEVDGERRDSALEMLGRLNSEYPGLNAKITDTRPYRNVSIQRAQYVFQGEEGKAVEIREDIGISKDAKSKKPKQMHQIEIHADGKTINKIKKRLIKFFGKDIFTQETKAQQPSENTGGDAR